MFPTLRAEETNMLFQAFRERRLRRRVGWFKRRIPSASMRVVVGLVVAVVAVVLGWWVYTSLSRFGLIVLIGGGLLIREILEMIRKRRTQRFAPTARRCRLYL
jgi:Flp pilus assembly protein TadB